LEQLKLEQLKLANKPRIAPVLNWAPRH
jgi:hypothetical protein